METNKENRKGHIGEEQKNADKGKGKAEGKMRGALFSEVNHPVTPVL